MDVDTMKGGGECQSWFFQETFQTPLVYRNNILKFPVIPAGAFSVIQDGVQDGHQNVKTAIYQLVINITL